MKLSRNIIRKKRKRRIFVKGTGSKPRISVFRSLRAIYAQLIDDQTGKTILAVNSQELKIDKYDQEAAKTVGKMIAQKAKEKGIESAVFDRGGYRYHGKVKALADGVREGGLKL